MSEQQGIRVENHCYECMIIARDVAEGFTFSKCQTCQDNEEAQADNKAWNLHEDDRLWEPNPMSYDTSDEPSASDWVSSQTISQPARSKPMFKEIWDEEKFHLIELSVKFLDPDEPHLYRNEFTPPIAQLMDGGVHEELWELEDYTQLQREKECQWCHILTPKIFNDCQSCDKPLENNLI